MKRKIILVILGAILCFSAGMISADTDPDDKEGSKDPALLNRMPGYYIYRYDEVEFDSYEFIVGVKKIQKVEGHHYFLIYYPKEGIKKPSPVQVTRNYINAIKKIGGELVYSYQDPDEDAVLRVVQNNKETWLYVSASANGIYSLQIIERDLMKQDVVADANSLYKMIKETGKAYVYGIYFEPAKADLKGAESEPALAEVVKLLQNHTELKLYVVGHTDNAGSLDAGLKLSKERADAVLKALVAKYKAAAGRLLACGIGPLSPVTSNLTDEGRLLNQRVELVAQIAN